jgi:hypothetical protein
VRGKSLYVVGFVVHFLLVIAVCCRETFSLLAAGATIFPPSLNGIYRKAEGFFSATLGQRLDASNAVRQIVSAYLDAAGIGAGYGYFAPNVPDSYIIVFELHYADGHVEYVPPALSGGAGRVRLTGLLDEIGRLTDESLRAIMIRTLAYSVKQQHPDAQTIHALLGVIRMPSLKDYQRGRKESYEFFYAHDFSFPSSSSPRPNL